MTVVIVLALVLSAQVAFADTTWSPHSKTITLSPGKSTTFDMDLQLGAKPIPKVDVLFVFDVTSSMAGELDSAKTRGAKLMDTILGYTSGVHFGVHFGVASFCDYPGEFTYPGYSSTYGGTGDYPWKLGQSVGPSVSKAQSAIEGLSIHDGQDGPEDYSRALYEAGQDGVGWRDDAKKIVVVFGDAPPHDLTFGGENTGGDPGRDKVADTSDDLRYKDVIAGLKKRGIAVVAVDCGSSPQATEAFKYAVSETAGGYSELSDTSKLEKTTEALIKNETTTVDRLEAKVTGANAGWAKVADPVRKSVAAKSDVKYKVTVTAPSSGTGIGGKRIGDLMVVVVADGVDVANTEVNVLVKGPSKPTGFLPSNNGYNWLNAGSSSDWDQFKDYYGTDEVQTSAGVHYWAADKDFNNNWKNVASYGSCFGMSESAIALQQGLDSWSTLPASKHLADLNPPKSYNWWDIHFDTSTEYEMLRKYAPRQKDLRVALLRADGQAGLPSQVLSQIEDYLDQGQPVAVDIWWYKESAKKMEGHSLAAYRYDSPSDKETRVYVYDSNYPKDDGCYISFDKDHDGWEYAINSDWDAYKDLHHLDSEYWSWGKGGDYHDRALIFGGWKSMSKTVKDAIGDSCMIDCIPVQAVLRTGVPNWNAPKGSMEGFPTSRIRAASASVASVSSARDFEVSSSGKIYFAGPSEFSRTASQTPPSEATYVCASGAPVSISVEPSSSGDTAIQMTSPGEFVGLDGITDSGVNALLQASGTGTVKSRGSAAEFSYSVSRESSGSSHAINIAAVSANATGGETFTPSDDLRKLDVVNAGPPTTYNVEVHAIGAGGMSYGASKLTLATGDRHETVVSDWSNLASAAPVVLVDHGNKGSFDQTITLAPISGTSSGAGGGGDGDDAGLWIVLFGAALVGGVGWSVMSGRNRQPAFAGQAAAASVAPSASYPARLLLSSGRPLGLKTGSNLIGRSPESDVALDDESVSRRHASITLGRSMAYLRDEGSSTGTFVNGVQVTEAQLFEGDTIQVGQTTFTFHRTGDTSA